MLNDDYKAGWATALERFDVKDAGLKEKLMPFMLAAGIGGGGTGAAAAVKHMMPHHAPIPMAEPMGPAAPMAQAGRALPQNLPLFQRAISQEQGKLDQILNAR
jgi:hypothetical protein